MKYIQNRESFKSGLIIKESSKVIEDLKINEAWTDKYDTLPSYQDSYGGRLLSFIFRKGVEKVNTGRVTKLLTDLENAINESIIEEVKKDEGTKKILDETEKKSFISGIWEKIKKSKSKQDIEHVNDAIKTEAEIVPVEEIPMPIQVVINYFDQRVVNLGNTEEKSTETKSGTTEATKEEPVKSEQTQEQPSSKSEESITHNFVLDLLSSKNPYDMLKDKQIRKQFFVDLKTLINTKDYGQILISYMDDKLKSDLNKLSIFGKSPVTNTSAQEDAKLANIEKLKRQRIQKQEDLKNKPKGDKKNILKNIEKIESTHESIVYEAVDDILGDTLSMREDSIKKLVGSLNKFFGDKRIKKQTVIQKFFAKVNKLYQTFLGEGGETKKTETPKVEKEVFNPQKEVTKEEVQTLLPVLYKQMDEEQKDESVKIINLLNKGFKEEEGDKFTFNSGGLDEVIKKTTNIENTDVDPKLDSEVEKKSKNASIDPLEIVRVFNRANKIMVVNYMPSNRSEGKVSKRVANDYETLDGGAPKLSNDNGPYRNKKLWNVWNDGVLSLMNDKKYKEVLNTTTTIRYENGKPIEVKANAPILKFMAEMLNDSRATGGKEAHQLEFLEKYFGISKEDTNAYSKGGYGYNNTKGDIFNNDKEQQTSSNSTTASFTDIKKDGSKVTKIVLSKMRDTKSGYGFSFQGTISGIKAYEGKVATLYCVGIKTFNKDRILFKMSINNDWFVQSYNKRIKYTPEREEDRKNNIVYLMMSQYNDDIVENGKLDLNIVQCVVSDKLEEKELLNITVSNIKKIRILHGSDGLMMRLDSPDKDMRKKFGPKDLFYTQPDTISNIYNKMKNNPNWK